MPDELFSEGWRDPGDDAHRMLYYVSWALGFVGGIGLSLYSISLILRHRGVSIEVEPGDSTAIGYLPYLLAPLGLLLAARAALKLYPEVKRLKGQRHSPEALVAGGFVLGGTLVFLGLERMLWTASQTRIEIFFISGIVVLAVSFGAGIVMAISPKLRARPRTLESVVIESRYAMDKRLMEIEDHPDPFGEGCIAMVRLRTPAGEVLDLRAGPAAYDAAERGRRGQARIAGKRLMAFAPRGFGGSMKS